MIIDKVDIMDVAVVEPENNTPIAGDGNAPKSPQITSQRVQAKARQTQIHRFLRRVQQTKGFLDPA